MATIDKITKARAGLILDQPFFGSLALRLKIKEDRSFRTGYTNGTVLGYNPEWVDTLSLEEVKGFICHEIMHIACSHQTRRQWRDPKKWNIACDYAINLILIDSGFTLPDDVLVSDQYKNMSAEEIYAKLPPNLLFDENNDPGGCGAVKDAEGEDGRPLSHKELAQVEQDWKVAISQAAQQAKMMGDLPAEVDRLVKKILEPVVNWKEVLRRFIEQSAKNDYTWKIPNKRYIHGNLYLPSLLSEELKPIAIAVDTSGSIGQEELDRFAAEITGILQDCKTSCTVIYCDTEVQRTEEFNSDTPVKLNPKGGGGTDFRPIFQYIEKHGLGISCLIYLTDMEGEFPETVPNYPVLWAKIGDSKINPPFGEEVKILAM